MAATRTLSRTGFDESVAKHVARKCLGGKDERFHGNEPNAGTLLAKIVPSLQERFMSEDVQYAYLFLLDDDTITVRAEANWLLFSVLELLVHPASPAADWLEGSSLAFPFDGKRVLLEFARRLMHIGDPFQGTADMLSVIVGPSEDPQDSIADFNAALTAARLKNTLDDEEVKSLFIAALDVTYYQAVLSRLLLHDQRAAVDLLTDSAVGPRVPYRAHGWPSEADGEPPASLRLRPRLTVRTLHGRPVRRGLRHGGLGAAGAGLAQGREAPRGKGQRAGLHTAGGQARHAQGGHSLCCRTRQGRRRKLLTEQL